MATADYIIVVCFLLGIYLVGSYFYRWVGSPDDFYVAGRQLTPFILASALTTANISLYSFIGVSGIAYRDGISIIWQTWTGNMALAFSGIFVIPILRRLRIRTIPEFLEMRYNGAVRLMVSAVWIFRLAAWLGVLLYAGVTAMQWLSRIQSAVLWIVVFTVIVVAYTMRGGMWSIALTNSLQFLLMMTAVLVILPLAMHAVGWWPSLVAHLPASYTLLVPQSGKYNWKFIIAMWLLGINWACLDQSLLQPAFSAKDIRVVAKGMVLAGIMTTPFAFLWVSPGLAAQVLHPGLAKPEMALPYLVQRLLPNGARGLVVCGLLAAGIGTIGMGLGASATLFTHDIYARYLNKEATKERILQVARVATLAAGLLMIGVCYAVPYLGGTVDAYLTIISVMDMPLFVIAVIYGLLWKRATWQGAIAGYLSGAVVGAVLRFVLHFEMAAVTFLSGGIAAFVCPLVSLLTGKTESEKLQIIFSAKQRSDEEQTSGMAYNLAPVSVGGRISIGILSMGLAVFFAGVLMGSRAMRQASFIAVAGMVTYFAGAILRTRFD